MPRIVRAGRPRSQEAIVHTLDRELGLHHARESGKEPCAGLKNHSPLEGESARGRSPQSSRWGANAAPRARPVSDYQRQEQRSLGGVLRVLEGYRQVSWRTLCQLNRTSITQASLFSPSPGSTLILGSCASWRSGPSRRRARRPPRRRARPDPPRTAYTRARGLNSPAGWPRPVCGANTRSWCRAGS